MLSIITFIIILSLLIFVHELGHFLLAKKNDIVIEEFGFGYPPRAFKFWQGEGRITLNGVPYIIPQPVNIARTLGVGSRVEFEAGKDMKGRNIIVRLTSLPDEVGRKENDRGAILEDIRRPTEYSINWIPFGGFVRLLGEEDPKSPGSFASKDKGVRISVLLAGAIMNIVAAVFVFGAMYMTGIPEPTGIISIQKIAPASPAAESGLAAGDIILAINGIKTKNTLEVADIVSQNRGKEISIQLTRGGEQVMIHLIPRSNPPPGEGAIGILMDFKITGQDLAKFSFLPAMSNGLRLTFLSLVNTFLIPVAIFKGMIQLADARPVGIYGLYQLADSAVAASVVVQGLYPILFLAGALSAALAVTQLLPLPALDGGRILFIVIEAIRGKRLSPEKEGAIHFIGFAILLGLMFVITYFDIANPIHIPDWVKIY